VRVRAPHWLSCLLLLPCLSACRSEPPTKSATALASEQPAPAEQPPAPPAFEVKPDEVEVTVVKDAAALHKAIAELKGKVVVVNFWALWCPTCVEEFPHMTAAWQAVKDQDVVLLTVNGDFPEDLEPKVKPFLAEHGVKDHAFMTVVEDDVKFIDEFGHGFDGTYPTTITFSRSGKLVETHVGEATREQFDTLLQKAIATE